MTIDEIMEYKIRDYLSERFYLEGKDKDYYFGRNPLNQCLTVFYNDDKVKGKVGAAESDSYIAFCLENNLTRYDSCYLDLEDSALSIPVVIIKHIYYADNSNDKKTYCISYMKTGVLAESMKKEQKRWKMYQEKHGLKLEI